MELLYIWIKEYGTISSKGFNLSGEFRFKYNEIENTLMITKNDNYIDNFFGDYNSKNVSISNITGIIGENGAGKSTLLEFIKNNICYGAGGIKHPCIIAFKDENVKKIYCHSSIKIKESNCKEYEFTINTFKEKGEKYQSFEVLHMHELQEFALTSFVFFSNIFDSKRQEAECGNLYNISTNYLVRADKKNSSELKIYSENASEVEIHRIQEIERQVRFLCNAPDIKKLLPFNLPEAVIASPINIDFRINNISYKDKRVIASCNDLIKEINKRLEDSHKEIQNNYNEFRYKFYHTVINNFIYEMINYTNIDIKSYDTLFSLPNSKSINIYESIKEFFRRLAAFSPARSSGLLAAYQDWFQGILDLLEYVDKNFERTKIDGSNSLVVPIYSEDEGVKFLELTELLKKALRIIPIFSFDWRDLSSGEKALLNIYSRFYSRADGMVTSNQELNSSIILLIDEGEVYLHPQWQKSMISNLLRFLTKAYANENSEFRRQIQIILTSNSPFIASDLPLSNIIFLKKEKHQSIVVDGLDEKRQTFGANIHTLLSDAFFIKDGLIGDYAKHKINGLIDILINYSPDKIQRDKELIIKLIDLVGEPIIKSKLLSMLNDKIALNSLNIDEKISNLQRQIDELNRGRKNDISS